MGVVTVVRRRVITDKTHQFFGPGKTFQAVNKNMINILNKP